MCFQSFTICETLKTRVKLHLNFSRPHAITYTNINQRFGDKSLIRIRMRDSDRTMSVDWPLFQTLSYSPKLPNPFYLCFQFSIYEVVYLDGEITLVLVTNLFSPKVNNVVYSYKWSVVILRSPDEFLKKSFSGKPY